MTSATFPPAILIMGPTASGKTDSAVELAQRLPVEIISVDSALVYRGMDIGTAKPEASVLAAAPHHLIDILDPDQSYSAAQFVKDATLLMAEITARGKVPLLVGGTMMYFNALLNGLSQLPEANAEMRARLEEEAAEIGWPGLHARLASVDPSSAARIKPNDSQRLQRALEVYEMTGVPMTQILGRSRTESLPYRWLKIGLMPSDRSVLHDRIAKRYDRMLQSGFADEVADLRRRYPALSLSMPSMRCVGYRQMWQYLEGELDYESMRHKGVAATRQLAKRQMTWLRGMSEVHTLDCISIIHVDSIISRASEFLDL